MSDSALTVVSASGGKFAFSQNGTSLSLLLEPSFGGSSSASGAVFNPLNLLKPGPPHSGRPAESARIHQEDRLRKISHD